MEILSPAWYLSTPNWLLDDSSSRSTKWTPAENKIFENALAVYDEQTPDRWQKVAALIPGKTVRDVMKQYKELEDDVCSIEAGFVPFPGYGSSAFTLEWENSHGFYGSKQLYGSGRKRPSSARPPEQERKKGVPWTEEEHKRFLMGLKKYGKGDWRNISRNFVITRTPTQVASHAQKYFIRQLSGAKDKRRASIHDITTVKFVDNPTPSPETTKPPSTGQPSGVHRQQGPGSMTRTLSQLNQPNSGAEMALNPTYGNVFMSPSGDTSIGLKMQAQNLQRSDMHQYSYVGSSPFSWMMM
ncbi:transcription factor DIVARICATA-like [Diospyros lotus]|uniref:transcription factor DIVARICATA-like n=1 Tax=Diospyros lotus TaxID=55363 RepID=UPI0022527F09|nr:transcription factor DIVARICATA-like [Diospyros lotus]